MVSAGMRGRFVPSEPLKTSYTNEGMNRKRGVGGFKKIKANLPKRGNGQGSSGCVGCGRDQERNREGGSRRGVGNKGGGLHHIIPSGVFFSGTTRPIDPETRRIRYTYPYYKNHAHFQIFSTPLSSPSRSPHHIQHPISYK